MHARSQSCAPNEPLPQQLHSLQPARLWKTSQPPKPAGTPHHHHPHHLLRHVAVGSSWRGTVVLDVLRTPTKIQGGTETLLAKLKPFAVVSRLCPIPISLEISFSSSLLVRGKDLHFRKRVPRLILHGVQPVTTGFPCCASPNVNTSLPPPSLPLPTSSFSTQR